MTISGRGIRSLGSRARFFGGTCVQTLDPGRPFRRAANAATTPEEIVQAACTVSAPGIWLKPSQIRSEIIDLVALVQAERPRRVLEIGTSHAGTLYMLAWASVDDARILSLDVLSYDWRRRRLHRRLARGRQRVEVRSADSHLDATRDAAVHFFGAGQLDVLLIDGDHSYEGVRRDYELYSKLVRPGGIIALHDIVDGPEGSVGGVPRFWRELRPTLDDPVELVNSWTQGGYGFGVARRRG